MNKIGNLQQNRARTTCQRPETGRSIKPEMQAACPPNRSSISFLVGEKCNMMWPKELAIGYLYYTADRSLMGLASYFPERWA